MNFISYSSKRVMCWISPWTGVALFIAGWSYSLWLFYYGARRADVVSGLTSTEDIHGRIVYVHKMTHVFLVFSEPAGMAIFLLIYLAQSRWCKQPQSH